MHTVGLNRSPVRVIQGELAKPPDIYTATVADLGFNPETVFSGDGPTVKCQCRWPGHEAYHFSGMGGEGARTSSRP